jgi:8-oxo-dGTP pyrophosphatase MutT (NUDIX family)
MEETGYQGKDWKQIGTLDPVPGYLNSPMHVVMTKIDGEKVDATEKDELNELQKIDIDEAIEMVKRGEMDELQVVAAIFLAKQFMD